MRFSVSCALRLNLTGVPIFFNPVQSEKNRNTRVSRSPVDRRGATRLEESKWREVVLDNIKLRNAILQKDSTYLRYMPDTIRNNEIITIRAIMNNIDVYNYIPNKLRYNIDIAKTVITKDPYSIKLLIKYFNIQSTQNIWN